jgi:hypothetical protein
MIQLTDELRRSLEKDLGVGLTDTDTSRPYVVLPKEVFERPQQLLHASEWGADELRLTLARSAAANGWNEPEMAADDRYDEEIQKRCP